MKQIYKAAILILTLFAVGFLTCLFTVKINLSEEQAKPQPIYDSEWKTERDSLFRLIETLENVEPEYVTITKWKEKPADPEDKEPDFLKNIPERIKEKVSPIGINEFSRDFYYTPSDFPEAIANGDSIWATINAHVKSSLAQTEAGMLAAKNEMDVKISSLEFRQLPIIINHKKGFSWLLSSDFMFRTTDKGFFIPLGIGLKYKPWGFGGSIKADSDKAYGFGIQKEFDF